MAAHRLTPLALIAVLLVLSVPLAAQETTPPPEAPTETPTDVPPPTDVPTDVLPPTDVPTATAVPPIDIPSATPSETPALTPEQIPSVAEFTDTAPMPEITETRPSPEIKPDVEATLALDLTPEATSALELTEASTPALTPDATPLPPEPGLTQVATVALNTTELDMELENTFVDFNEFDGELGLIVDRTGTDITFRHEPLYDSAAAVRVYLSNATVYLKVRQNDALSYRATLNPQGEVVLFRADQPVASASVTIDPQAWQTLRLSAVDNSVRVSVNQVEVLALVDDAPLPPGEVSFGADSLAGGDGLLVSQLDVWENAQAVALAAAAPVFAPVGYSPAGFSTLLNASERLYALVETPSGLAIDVYDSSGLVESFDLPTLPVPAGVVNPTCPARGASQHTFAASPDGTKFVLYCSMWSAPFDYSSPYYPVLIERNGSQLAASVLVTPLEYVAFGNCCIRHFNAFSAAGQWIVFSENTSGIRNGELVFPHLSIVNVETGVMHTLLTRDVRFTLSGASSGWGEDDYIYYYDYTNGQPGTYRIKVNFSNGAAETFVGFGTPELVRAGTYNVLYDVNSTYFLRRGDGTADRVVERFDHGGAENVLQAEHLSNDSQDVMYNGCAANNGSICKFDMTTRYEYGVSLYRPVFRFDVVRQTTPTPTATAYAIQIISDVTNSRAWTLNEVQEIQSAVLEIGTAFNTVTTHTPSQPAVAFNRVYSSVPQVYPPFVLFVRADTSSDSPWRSPDTLNAANDPAIPDVTVTFTTTAGAVSGYYEDINNGNCKAFEARLFVVSNPSSAPRTNSTVAMPSAVVCNGDLLNQTPNTSQPVSQVAGEASQYTLVHELGHIFDYLTSASRLGVVTDSIDGGADAAGTIGTGDFVLGGCVSIATDSRSSTVMGEFEGEWRRGSRGWGSAPPFSRFLQSPDRLSTLEAAADMFLNWVYRTNRNGVTAISGYFTDREAAPTAGCVPLANQTQGGQIVETWIDGGFYNRAPNDNQSIITATFEWALSGDIRQALMNDIVQSIFTAQGW